MNEELQINVNNKEKLIPIVSPETDRELVDMLHRYGLWSEDWTLEIAQDLLREIKDEEKRLVLYFDEDDIDQKNARLGADVEIVSIDVHSNIDGVNLELKELFQSSIFIYGDPEKPDSANATSRVRNNKRSMSGKVAEGEDVWETAKREMAEELQVHNPKIDFVEKIEEKKVSGGYPGLMTFYKINVFKAEISEEEYKEFYLNIEDIPKGKSDYAKRFEGFVWEPANKKAA